MDIVFIALLLTSRLQSDSAREASAANRAESVLSYEDCLEILRGHEQAAGRILLRFKADLLVESSSDSKTVCEEGYWLAWDDRRGAVTVAGNPSSQPRYERGTWTGTHGLLVRGPAEWPQLEEYLAGRREDLAMQLTRTTARHPGPLSRIEMPGELGFCFLNTPWSEYLRGMRKQAVIGEQEVLSRRCQVIVFDMDREAPPDAFKYPWRLSFDSDDTRLILRAESFFSAENASQEMRERAAVMGGTLTIGGDTWYRLLHIEVARVATIGGIQLGVEGTVGFEDDPSHVMHVTVDELRSRPAQLVDTWLLEPPQTPGIKIRDDLRGMITYVGHEASVDYSHCVKFADLLAAFVGPAYADDWRLSSGMCDPLSTTPSAVLALYLCRSLGVWGDELSECESALATCTVLPITMEALPQSEWAIAAETSDLCEADTLQLVRRNGNTVDFISIPGLFSGQLEEHAWLLRNGSLKVFPVNQLQTGPRSSRALAAIGLALGLGLLAAILKVRSLRARTAPLLAGNGNE